MFDNETQHFGLKKTRQEITLIDASGAPIGRSYLSYRRKLDALRYYLRLDMDVPVYFHYGEQVKLVMFKCGEMTFDGILAKAIESHSARLERPEIVHMTMHGQFIVVKDQCGINGDLLGVFNGHYIYQVNPFELHYRLREQHDDQLPALMLEHLAQYQSLPTEKRPVTCLPPTLVRDEELPSQRHGFHRPLTYQLPAPPPSYEDAFPGKLQVELHL